MVREAQQQEQGRAGGHDREVSKVWIDTGVRPAFVRYARHSEMIITLHRDRIWRRDQELRVESVVDAEPFIEDVVFLNTLTDFAAGAERLHLPRRTSHGPEGPRGISNTFSITEESILISLNLRTTVS